MSSIVNLLNKKNYATIVMVFWVTNFIMLAIGIAQSLATKSLIAKFGETCSANVFLESFDSVISLTSIVLQVLVLMWSIIIPLTCTNNSAKILKITFNLFVLFVNKASSGIEEKATDKNSMVFFYLAFILINANMIILRLILTAAAVYATYR